MDKKKKETRLAKALKAYRAKAGITQAQFADAVGMKECNINAYEQSRSRPQYEVLKRIIKFMDVSLEDVV